MSTLYPLRFQPILRRYLWGGRRLETALGKPLGAGADYAESWEIADHDHDQSVVLAGPLAGVTLGRLTREEGTALLGRNYPQPRFPLLVKFLDAQLALSLQVHPDDLLAQTLDPPDLGKTEAWVILEAAPGSYLYAGLKAGVDRETFERELARGECHACVERIEPSAGDCFFIPAGVPHALGPGLLVAEIQQSSDVTYRLFDWNRLGPDGRPRTLHIVEGLTAIDFENFKSPRQTPRPAEQSGVEQLVACDKFVINRHRTSQAVRVGGDERCRILIVLEGALRLEGDPADGPLVKGGVAMLPASIGSVKVSPLGPTTFLEAHLP